MSTSALNTMRLKVAASGGVPHGGAVHSAVEQWSLVDILQRIEYKFDYASPSTELAKAPRDSADPGARDTRSARAWSSTPSISVGVTAQTHLVVLMGFGVLPILPIVEAKAALPGLGHTQIMLPA